MNQQLQVENPPDIFLCHSKTDRDFVHRMAERIESEPFNGRTLRVAFDEWDVNPGANVVLRLSALLEKSRFLGVFLSPEMVDSGFCTFEWSSFAYTDPANLKARIIPMIVRREDLAGERRLEIPWALRSQSYLDFSKPGNYQSEYKKLTCRLKGEPLPRGRGAKVQPLKGISPAAAVTVGLPDTQEAPDLVDEVLLSNLLPVTNHPTTIWSAPATISKRNEVWDALTKAEDRDAVVPFILKEGRIYTFADLAHHTGPITRFIHKQGFRSDPVGLWQKEPSRWRWYVELLHNALRNHARGNLGLGYDKDRRRYFFYPDKGRNRIYQYRAVGQPRTVAQRCPREDGTEFWVHQACEMRFETLGARLYLRLVPSWLFTEDGDKLLQGPRVGPLSMRWSAKERNGAILRHILFWATVLGKRKDVIRIPTGGPDITLLPRPTRTISPVGVACDLLQPQTLIEAPDQDLTLAVKAVAADTEELEEGLE